MRDLSQYNAQIQQEAKAAWPKEAVWLITETRCIFVENAANDPEHDFEVRPEDQVSAVKEGLVAVVHSHPGADPVPSLPDMRSQEAMGVPWGIVSCGEDYCSLPLWFGPDAPKAPLMDRPFAHGIYDCYSFIRDWYAEKLNIALPDFPRAWEWWKDETDDSFDFYQDQPEKNGFHRVELSEAKVGDLILFKLKSKKINHGAVYIGDGLMVHHLTASLPYDPTRRPSTEPVSRWASLVEIVYRHKDAP